MERSLSDSAGLTRRTVVATIAAGGIAGLAGCLGDGREGPDPVSLDQGQACDNCDMQIEMHPGPVGQSFYGDDAPATLPDDRQDGVAWFCSTTCTYTFLLEQEERGYEPVISYGTDYSTVDYDLRDEGGATVISAHLDADAFADLHDLHFVVASSVEGSMGGSMIGFSDVSEAEAFADDHGGELLEHGDVNREVLSGLTM